MSDSIYLRLRMDILRDLLRRIKPKSFRLRIRAQERGSTRIARLRKSKA